MIHQTEAMPLDVLSVLVDVETELNAARRANAPMNSAHEGWAVIKEELDELWDEVRKKRSQRSRLAMRQECIQIAAMAVRLILDVVEKTPADPPSPRSMAITDAVNKCESIADITRVAGG